MVNLTTKELSIIKEQLGCEQVLVKKYSSYVNELSDPELKTKCEQIATKHQAHYNSLLKQLQ